MTENESIKILKRDLAIQIENKALPDGIKAIETAIQALEEIQQYRAMEERLNGISVEQTVNGFINLVEKETHEGYERGRILTNAEADMWNACRAIGTVEEFKALKEKNVAKKPIRSATSMYGWDCPNCKDYVYNDYWDNDIMPPKRCDICGQALDWSE